MPFNFGGQPDAQPAAATGFSFGGQSPSAPGAPTFSFGNLDFSKPADDDDDDDDDEDEDEEYDENEEEDEEDNWLFTVGEPMTEDDIRANFGLEEDAIVMKLKANWVRNMGGIHTPLCTPTHPILPFTPLHPPKHPLYSLYALYSPRYAPTIHPE